MKAINTNYRPQCIGEIQQELPFFMKYMSDVVDQLIQGKIGLRAFEEAYQISYSEALQDSRNIDEAYERGEYGRPGIMDGGPDYISYFEKDKRRCLEILQQKGISLAIC